MVIAIEPFLGSLLPSGRCPRGTSVLRDEPGRWVVWEGPGDLLVFVLRKPEKKVYGQIRANLSHFQMLL